MARHALPKSKKPALGLVFALIASILIPVSSPVVATASVALSVTSVSPDSGSSAGGTQITISGTGFFDGGASSVVTSLEIGSDVITDYTVVDDSTITATISPRSGVARTIGSKQVIVGRTISGTGASSSDQVFFNFAPRHDPSLDNATAQPSGQVILGPLASRTEAKPIIRSGSDPYFVDGVDGLTGLPYRYQTNDDYDRGDSDDREAYQYEGTEVVASRVDTMTVTPKAGLTIDSRTSDVIELVQRTNCSSHLNTAAGYNSYCSIFGPEFYTEAFYATSTQALSFDWYAEGNTDDYEIYAYLVAVSDDASIPTPSAANHTLTTYGMGYRNGNNFWQTSTANIPADGLYRFRFVNGSYDGTGGKALGSTFYVGQVFTAGLRNEIDFGPISDRKNTGSFTVEATAGSGAEVTITSSTPNVCSVSTTFAAPTTSVTINASVSDSVCSLVASQGASTNYPAAPTKVVSFRVLSGSAVAASAPVITSVLEDDQQLTFTFTQPSFDGSEFISNYKYSVVQNGQAENFIAISPADTTSRQVTVTGLTNGTTYSITVRAVTNFGDGLTSSARTGTPRTLVGPEVEYAQPTQSATVGVLTNLVNPARISGDAVAGYTLSSGVLPAGLSLNTATGFISGIPTTTGSETVYVRAYNSGGTSSPVALTINIQSLPPTIAYASNTLNLDVLVAMSQATPTFGGNPLTSSQPVTYSGSLPAGLSIDLATGVISGTPTSVNASGDVIQVRAIGSENQLSNPFTLTIKVVDRLPDISVTQATYSLVISESATISAPTNTGGIIVSWAVSPSLPAGLSLNGSTGVISGTPSTTSDMAQFSLTATNGTGTSTVVLSIEVILPPVNDDTPVPVYSGPIITSINPNVVTVEGGETVVVTGRRLGTAEELYVGQELVRILSSSNTEITFVMPTMVTGVYDMLYVYSGGARLNYFNAITVVPKSVTSADAADRNNQVVRPNFGSAEAWLRPWSVTDVVNPFAPGSSVLTNNLKSIVRKHVRTYAQFASHVSCAGFTMGPTVLRVDAALSLRRAQAVCDYVAELRPRLVVDSVQGRQDLIVADRIRRAEVTFFRPGAATPATD